VDSVRRLFLSHSRSSTEGRGFRSTPILRAPLPYGLQPHTPAFCILLSGSNRPLGSVLIVAGHASADDVHGFCIPPGGLKKRDCFRQQKNHPGGRPPPPSQNREVAEAPFCREVFRGLVGSYSSEVYMSGGGGSQAKCQASGRRWAVRRGASVKKCRSHSTPAFNNCSF
jgi:hypothetical protein